MSEPIARLQAQADVRAAIARGAQASGVDFDLLVKTAQRESALDSNARAGTSSATGLFQFIDSTWLDMVRRHGAEHGLAGYAQALQSGQADAATRRDILALRNDPEISARMAGELARENAATLQAQLGRAPSAGELYAAHVMGAGGALRLIEASAQYASNASQLFPREAEANRGLFYARDGAPLSAEGVLQRLDLATKGAPILNDAPSRSGGALGAMAPMSPDLAHALFQLAVLPLLRPDSQEQGPDLWAGLTAYRRSQV